MCFECMVFGAQCARPMPLLMITVFYWWLHARAKWNCLSVPVSIQHGLKIMNAKWLDIKKNCAHDNTDSTTNKNQKVIREPYIIYTLQRVCVCLTWLFRRKCKQRFPLKLLNSSTFMLRFIKSSTVFFLAISCHSLLCTITNIFTKFKYMYYGGDFVTPLFLSFNK